VRSSSISDSAYMVGAKRDAVHHSTLRQVYALPAFKPNSVLITTFLAKATPTKRLASEESPRSFRYCRWKCNLDFSPNFVAVMSSRLTLVLQLLLHLPLQRRSVWRVFILIPPASVNSLSASVLQLVLLPSATEVAAHCSCPKTSD